MNETFTALTGAGLPVTAACELVGRPRVSHYRHTRPPVQGPRPPRAPGPQTLTEAERAAVLQVINTPGYSDLPVGQVWARELDEGRYWGSMSSMYRIARVAGQTGERRRQATHPARVKPELVAMVRPRCGRGTSQSSADRPKGSGSSSTCCWTSTPGTTPVGSSPRPRVPCWQRISSTRRSP